MIQFFVQQNRSVYTTMQNRINPTFECLLLSQASVLPIKHILNSVKKYIIVAKLKRYIYGKQKEQTYINKYYRMVQYRHLKHIQIIGKLCKYINLPIFPTSKLRWRSNFRQRSILSRPSDLSIGRFLHIHFADFWCNIFSFN